MSVRDACPSSWELLINRFQRPFGLIIAMRPGGSSLVAWWRLTVSANLLSKKQWIHLWTLDYRPSFGNMPKPGLVAVAMFLSNLKCQCRGTYAGAGCILSGAQGFHPQSYQIWESSPVVKLLLLGVQWHLMFYHYIGGDDELWPRDPNADLKNILLIGEFSTYGSRFRYAKMDGKHMQIWKRIIVTHFL